MTKTRTLLLAGGVTAAVSAGLLYRTFGAFLPWNETAEARQLFDLAVAADVPRRLVFLPFQLLGEVSFVANFFDQVELCLQPVHMSFFVFQQSFEEIA